MAGARLAWRQVVWPLRNIHRGLTQTEVNQLHETRPVELPVMQPAVRPQTMGFGGLLTEEPPTILRLIRCVPCQRATLGCGMWDAQQYGDQVLTAEECRRHSVECRKLAEHTSNVRMQGILLDMARTWTRLGLEAEQWSQSGE
jgi:hypothetical protein